MIKGIEIKVLEKPKALEKPKELGKLKEPGYKQIFIFDWRVNLKKKINQWKDPNKKINNQKNKIKIEKENKNKYRIKWWDIKEKVNLT